VLYPHTVKENFRVTHFVRALSIAALLLFPVVRPKAQVINNVAATPADKADVFLKEALSAKRIPGMSICVVREGKVELARGSGLANVELSVPATEHTVFELASLTKPF